jgi:hypothetical protein
MDNQMTFGVVHVIEWLDAGDARTGSELFEELEPLGIASQPEVVTHLYRIKTKAEFFALFDDFEDEFRRTNRMPVLHVETHGSPEGIGANGDEYVLWPELMERMIPLNRLTGLNLVVILAACKGFWGLQMLQPGRGEAAFRGLVGPRDDLKAWQVKAACMAFYRTVFQTMNGDAAIQAMNDAVDTSKETFWTVGAELAFKLVFQGYLERYNTPGAIEERVAAMETKALAQRRADGLPDMFQKDKERGRKRLREYLTDNKGRFEDQWRKFFFVDEFSANAQRFDIKLEDCLPRSKGDSGR